MTDRRMTISPAVALNEAAALTEFYRNRVLIMAQDNADLREQLAAMQEAAKEKAQDEDG